MPTILSHAAVPLAIGFGLGRARVPAALIAAGVVLSMLPDLDVVGLRLGVPYGDAWGHRGASHALAAAALVGLPVAYLGRRRLAPAAVPAAAAFLFAAMASHGLLDALTNGGRGVALFWPASDARVFAPVRPIEVSPLSLRRFLSGAGAATLASELVWIWLPAAAAALALRLAVPRQRPARHLTRRPPDETPA